MNLQFITSNYEDDNDDLMRDVLWLQRSEVTEWIRESYIYPQKYSHWDEILCSESICIFKILHNNINNYVVIFGGMLLAVTSTFDEWIFF